jgi:hypothetical protein
MHVFIIYGLFYNNAVGSDTEAGATVDQLGATLVRTETPETVSFKTLASVQPVAAVLEYFCPHSWGAIYWIHTCSARVRCTYFTLMNQML